MHVLTWALSKAITATGLSWQASGLELYRYRVEPRIQTADTEYAADYDTDYDKPMFWPKSPKISYLPT